MKKNIQAQKKPGVIQNMDDKYSAILKNLDCGIIFLDSQLTIHVLNQWVRDHSNLGQSSYEGENFLKIFPDMKNTQLDKSIEAALRYQIKSILTPDINLNPLPLYEYESNPTDLRPDKKPLSHIINISPVVGNDDSIMCLIHISNIPSSTIRDSLFHEQSLRLYGEAEALRESSRIAEKANKAKSEFLALMSHELRTPLNAIIGFADILKGELLGPHSIAQYKDYAGDISEAGTHLLTLINDILDLSKIDAGKYALNDEIVDVPEIVKSAESLIRPLIDQNFQNLITTFPEDLPDLKVDVRSLKQMVLNLLSNAVKFTPDNGSISVNISRNDAGEMELSVSDNGIGIAKHEISMIMQPFTQAESNMTRERQGSGLGLALVKKMVEMHDGSINLTSQIGEGTTVTLTFPPQRVVAL